LVPAPTTVRVGAEPAGRAEARAADGQTVNLAAAELTCFLPPEHAGGAEEDGAGAAPVRLGSVRAAASDPLAAVLDKASALPGLPAGLAAVGFTYSPASGAALEVRGADAWERWQRALRADESLGLSAEVTLLLGRRGRRGAASLSVQAAAPVAIDPASSEAEALGAPGKSGGAGAGASAGAAGRECAPREPMRRGPRLTPASGMSRQCPAALLARRRLHL